MVALNKRLQITESKGFPPPKKRKENFSLRMIVISAH
jgi:hypothetical protein